MESLIFPLLIALLAIPLFLQARKQKRAMQDQQKLQNSLVVDDRVMTTSGLYGTVVATRDDDLDLEIAPGVTTTWVRAAVREKVETETAEVDDAADADESTATPAVESKATESETVESKATESGAEVAEPIERQKAN